MRINNRAQCRIEEDAMNVEIRFQAFQAFSNIAANTKVEKEGKNYCTLLNLITLRKLHFLFYRCTLVRCDIL